MYTMCCLECVGRSLIPTRYSMSTDFLYELMHNLFERFFFLSNIFDGFPWLPISLKTKQTVRSWYPFFDKRFDYITAIRAD